MKLWLLCNPLLALCFLSVKTLPVQWVWAWRQSNKLVGPKPHAIYSMHSKGETCRPSLLTSENHLSWRSSTDPGLRGLLSEHVCSPPHHPEHSLFYIWIPCGKKPCLTKLSPHNWGTDTLQSGSWSLCGSRYLLFTLAKSQVLVCGCYLYFNTDFMLSGSFPLQWFRGLLSG